MRARVHRALVLSVVVVPVLLWAQAKPAAGPDQALMDIEHRWAATALKGDGAALNGILAATWTGVASDGTVETRAQAIERTKASKFSKSEASAMKVTPLGANAAVVTGVWTGVGTGPKGEKIDTIERFTDVFVYQGGTWKSVASQGTTIKK